MVARARARCIVPSNSLASVRLCSVVGRVYQMALLVLLVAAASMMEVETAGSHGSSGVPSSSTPIKRSPRVFVNTSVPFSVAPQPVGDTREVAHAKHHFLRTFQRIHDAVVAADSEHLDFNVLEHELNNNLDDHRENEETQRNEDEPSSDRQDRMFSQRGPAPLIGSEPQPNFSLFPDPILEPEYFLPSVHVDPLLLNQLDPPLPRNPFIQQIRPINNPQLAGTCYEIVLLEPELDFFQNAHQGSQLIPVGTPAFPGIGSHKSVPHFRVPQRPFFSVQHGPLGGPLTPNRRFATQR